MFIVLVFALVALAPPARAALEIGEVEFLAQSRPLIDAFVTQQRALYQINLELDAKTWSVGPPTDASRVAWFRPLDGGKWDSSCRDVSAELNTLGYPRAHFYVRVSYPDAPILARPRGANPRYELVPSCDPGAVGLNKPELVFDGLRKDRHFTDEEFINLALPMVKSMLRLNKKSEIVDQSTLQLRRDGVDFAASERALGRTFTHASRRNLACRRLRVFVPAENATVTAFISVLYNHDDLTPFIPAEEQFILWDAKTFRPYRFALVNGCDVAGFFEPPSLRLRVRATAPAAVPVPAPVAGPN